MLIKLCDRLHNMRTGDGWPEQKRRDKALETMEVYAPTVSYTHLGAANGGIMQKRQTARSARRAA